MIALLMVDVDGVVLRPGPTGRWDASLLNDLGVDPAVLYQEFFARDWPDVVLGRADLFDRLGPVLARIAPSVSPQQLVDYWFAQDACVDEVLLADLAVLAGPAPSTGPASAGPALASPAVAGPELQLATVQEHHRARHLWQTVGLRDHFARMHYAAELGASKSDATFYRDVERRTGYAGDQIGLIDDSALNLEVAASVGWRTHLWRPSSRLADVPWLVRSAASADPD